MRRILIINYVDLSPTERAAKSIQKVAEFQHGFSPESLLSLTCPSKGTQVFGFSFYL